MNNIDKHIGYLFSAELQFRLASAVRLATTFQNQPLDLPIEWTHGKHRIYYREIALREDQANFAASCLHQSATFLMAVAMKDAIKAVINDPYNCADSDIRSAYQISRLIRNAFAHAPLQPTWSIDPPCRNKIFRVKDIIILDTSNLQDKPFDWRHYGGPLALFRLCQFVRHEILKDPKKRRKVIPLPQQFIYQQGDLLLKKVDKIPDDSKKIK
ncbi:MAG: hypothetical protein C0415_04940 [Thermodesulfovibrio sp.]|nr:hypothetical protein [Thermodesulfovibrio sp.]